MEAWGLLTEIVLLLAAALVAGGLLARLGQSPLLGYLLAGMFLGGPGSLGLIESEGSITVIAELGVALLLFSLGLEFSWRRLRSLGGRTLLGGAVQVVATTVVAAAVSHLLGLGLPAAIAVGAMISLSSTAAVLRVLMDLGEDDSLHGRACIAVLLVQDIAVVPFAVMVPLLAGTGEDAALDAGRVLLVGAGLVVGLYVLLHHVAVRLLASLAQERTRELVLLMAVVVGLGSTGAAHSVGLSPALGAFVAGMFLGGSPFATQVRADIASLRIVLLTLFFAAAGMVADPGWIAGHAGLVLGVATLVIGGKTLLAYGALRSLGRPRGVSAAAGLSLAQVGEFAFVLGGAALAAGVIVPDTYMLIVSTAIVSLFATPYLVALAPRLAARMERGGRGPGSAEEAPVHRHPDAVIIGYGPAGQAVGRFLASRRVPTVVVDLNPEARERAERIGHEGHIGDASQPEVLERAGVGSAKWVILTLPARAAAMSVLDQVHALNPGAVLIVRIRHHIHRAEFKTAGAHVVVDDEAEVGHAIEERLRIRLDASVGAAGKPAAGARPGTMVPERKEMP